MMSISSTISIFLGIVALTVTGVAISELACDWPWNGDPAGMVFLLFFSLLAASGCFLERL